jgi:broad specificity phosphatase PhoE
MTAANFVLFCFHLFTLPLAFSFTILSNTTEFLAISSVQAFNLPHLKEFYEQAILESNTIHSIPNLFYQQQGIYPLENETQLLNFGATKPWSELLSQLKLFPNRKLIIMIRHAEAWENLNPLGNDHCEFKDENGEVIQNFDSLISPAGFDQTQVLNELLRSIAPEDQNENQKLTWYETMGLTNPQYFTSPLSRTLQTANYSLYSLPMKNITASELLRASIGTDVCNFRHSVYTPTSEHQLPSPWRTGCELPSESLTSLYTCEDFEPTTACLNPLLPFQFPVRPSSGSGIGLISDSDQLWRSDMTDSSQIIRSITFLNELYDYYPEERVIGIVTHSEMISAIYQSLNEIPYSSKNTQIVPLMIERRN